jgi:hypothetical protein
MDATQEAAKALNDVKGAAAKVNEPMILEVQSAYQDLANAVDTIPGGRTTVGDAAISVKTNSKRLQIAWDRLYDRLQCGV